MCCAKRNLFASYLCRIKCPSIPALVETKKLPGKIRNQMPRGNGCPVSRVIYFGELVMRKILLNGMAVVAAAIVLTAASSAYAQVNVSWSVPYSSGSVVVPSPPVVYSSPVVYNSYAPAVVTTYRRPFLPRPVIARTVVTQPVVVSRPVVAAPIVTTPIVTTRVVAASPVVSTSYYAPLPPAPPVPVFYGGGVSVSAPYTRVIVGSPW